MKYRIIIKYSSLGWYKGGQQHRLHGPAWFSEHGSRIWFKDNQLHREDGPARELCNGTRQWWINDKQYTEEEFNKMIQSGEK